MQETEKENALKRIESDGVKFAQLQFIDLVGTLKAVTIPGNRFEESFSRGTWFDGSSVEGFARIHESDMILLPDPSTYALIPWNNHNGVTARFFCNVLTPQGKPFESDPRQILKKTIAEAEELGFVYNTGPELEFFLFKYDENRRLTQVTHDVGGYFDSPARDLATEIRKEIILALENFGIKTEMAHHEVAPGQHEIDFEYGNALPTADNAVTLKQTVKAIASQHNVFASFMPKPLFGVNGSGMHVHQSLFDKKGRNVFFDENSEYNLSETARHFIAGQLQFARQFSAVTAPTVNSYKRLVPGYEAPVYVCWGRINRSALIRVPSFSKGREKSMRAELRCPDPSCNPYLAFAAMLAAGLEGIKKKIEIPEPIEEDVYGFSAEKLKQAKIATLPGSLEEAICEFKKSGLMKSVFGEKTFSKYLEIKEIEWNQYRIQVTKWEHERYFETL